MRLLSDASLAGVNAARDRTLSGIYHFEQATIVNTDLGESKVWALVGTPFGARLTIFLRPEEQEEGSRTIQYEVYRVAVPFGLDIQSSWRLVSAGGAIYEIRGTEGSPDGGSVRYAIVAKV